ncbi:MAG TPA: TraB/GumN family protein [Vicinamibacterales bacterium]|nr:TraB/GumN family protein [Vicinamibacterales bacterium]
MAAKTTPRAPLSGGVPRRHFSWLLGSLIVASGALPKAQTRPGPALWVAEKLDTRVYLFGQMPVRFDTVWLTPEIEAAFNGSDLVWLENLDNSLITPEVMSAVGELQKQLTPSADFSVLSVLDEPHRERLLALLAAEGVSPESLNGRPIPFARQLVTSIQDRKSGADFTKIPEAIFRARAKAAGKPIFTEWRDLPELVRFASDLPEVQKQLVTMALDDLDRDYPAELSSWLSGALDIQIKSAEARAVRYPDLYLHVNTLRNQAMARRIVDVISNYRQLFVCLGIGHFVGPSSVPAFLGEAGLAVRRV